MNCSFCWYFEFDSQQVSSGRLCSELHINSTETSCRHWRNWHREDISWGAFANWENPKTEANVCNPHVCYLSRKTARCFRLKVGHWQKLSPSLVYFFCYWETLDKGVDHRAFDAFSTCLFFGRQIFRNTRPQGIHEPCDTALTIRFVLPATKQPRILRGVEWGKKKQDKSLDGLCVWLKICASSQ